MSQDSPGDLAWSDLQAQMEALRDDWHAVTRGLTGDETPPTVGNDLGDDEEHWSAAQIHSHVVSGLLRYTESLLQVVIAEAGSFRRSPRHLPDGTPYSSVRGIEEHAWTALLNAMQLVALQPNSGAAIAFDDQKLTTDQFAQRAVAHIQAHIEQISALRADAADLPKN